MSTDTWRRRTLAFKASPAGEILLVTVMGTHLSVCSLSTSEQQSSEEDMLDTETRRTITNTIYNTLCQGDSQVQTPRILTSPETEEKAGTEKGAREKRFSDGSVEVWYSNGNRCS